MIGFLSNERYIKRDKINDKQLESNMQIIAKNNDIYSQYITEIYNEYKLLIRKKSIDIKEELLGLTNVKKISNNDITNCQVIVSPSHLNTYYIIRELNPHKEELMVICFDMHCDTYDTSDELWKGNHFSRLLKEGYITDFVVFGVPKEKINNTYSDVSVDIKDKVLISDNLDFKSVLIKYKPQRIFISIDIDVLDTRKSKYTAIDYCPHTVLECVSKLNVKDLLNDNSEELIKGCVLIKNNLGYANLYKTGENNISIELLCQKIKSIISYCKQNNIKLGFNNIFGDISELIGNDYNYKTLSVIIKLINALGGDINEKTIRRKS